VNLRRTVSERRVKDESKSGHCRNEEGQTKGGSSLLQRRNEIKRGKGYQGRARKKNAGGGKRGVESVERYGCEVKYEKA